MLVPLTLDIDYIYISRQITPQTTDKAITDNQGSKYIYVQKWED